jgi:hypothetical protein
LLDSTLRAKSLSLSHGSDIIRSVYLLFRLSFISIYSRYHPIPPTPKVLSIINHSSFGSLVYFINTSFSATILIFLVHVTSNDNLATTFMWRVHSTTSASDNSEDGFLAHALCKRVADKYVVEPCSRRRGLYDLEQSEMRDMLRDHLAWKKRNGSFESRFISVTTSPPFALHLAIQKNARMQREKKAAEYLAKEVAESEKKEPSRKTRTRRQHETNEDAGINLLKKKRIVNFLGENIHISILDMSGLPKEHCCSRLTRWPELPRMGSPRLKTSRFSSRNILSGKP